MQSAIAAKQVLNDQKRDFGAERPEICAERPVHYFTYSVWHPKLPPTSTTKLLVEQQSRVCSPHSCVSVGSTTPPALSISDMSLSCGLYATQRVVRCPSLRSRGPGHSAPTSDARAVSCLRPSQTAALGPRSHSSRRGATRSAAGWRQVSPPHGSGSFGRTPRQGFGL